MYQAQKETHADVKLVLREELKKACQERARLEKENQAIKAEMQRLHDETIAPLEKANQKLMEQISERGEELKKLEMRDCVQGLGSVIAALQQRADILWGEEQTEDRERLNLLEQELNDANGQTRKHGIFIFMMRMALGILTVAYHIRMEEWNRLLQKKQKENQEISDINAGMKQQIEAAQAEKQKLQERIGELAGQAQNNQTIQENLQLEIHNIQSKFQDLQSNFQTVESKLKSTKSELTAAQEQNKKLNQSIDGWKTKVSEQDKKLQEKEGELAKQEKIIFEKSQAITKLDREKKNVQQENANMKEVLQKKENELEELENDRNRQKSRASNYAIAFWSLIGIAIMIMVCASL